MSTRIPSPVGAPASLQPFSFRQTRLRGVNLGGWFSQVDDLYAKDPDRNPGLHAHVRSFLGPADFARVKSWGFNHVRIPLDYYNAFDRQTLVPDELVLGEYVRAVSAAEAAGLAVIVDLHRCPGHDFHSGTLHEQPFFHDPACREDAKRVWSILAERLGDRPLVALEVLNEPVAPTNALWNKVKDELCAHIRRAAPKSTIVVGSNRWNTAAELADLRPVDDDNILYSVHCYAPLLFTHQKAPWLQGEVFLQERSWPGDYGADPGEKMRIIPEFGAWNKDRLARVLEAATNFRARHQVPVSCNEFGVYAPAPLADRLRYMNDMMDIFRASDLGWSYWNYKNLDFGLFSQGEKLHESLPQYANAERLDRDTLAILQAG
jgi:aryl-phospho-beta-D-glucosidase BglC (GH1 family)